MESAASGGTISQRNRYTHFPAKEVKHLARKVLNKADLVDEIRKNADLTKDKAAEALQAVLDAITTALKKRNKVQITGFGTFETRRRKARKGRNPSTMAEIKIPAKTVPHFRPGKALRDAM